MKPPNQAFQRIWGRLVIAHLVVHASSHFDRTINISWTRTKDWLPAYAGMKDRAYAIGETQEYIVAC